MAQTVNLTAAPTQTVLPDGQAVPMWGYSCGGVVSGSTSTCAALNPAAAGNWSPVVITVPYIGAGTSLTINLANNLRFTAGTGTNTVPTSIVIVGQLGGGLGDSATTTPSPVHPPMGTTWPAAGGPDTSGQPGGDPASAGNPTFTPPPQPPRVQSFSTEVAADGVPVALTWSNLRPGTYLIQSGTHPSIQEPMGLYGVLVVTTPADGATSAQAYAGLDYDADVPMAFSEIDPVQNRAVQAAVSTPDFSETAVWNGQPGGCGDPASSTYNTCYPPVVNYSPLYYLINGVSLDRTNLAASTIPVLQPASAATPVPAPTGKLLLRLVNAGLRMHVPSVVNATMTLFAEDGNPLPGSPRLQNEVFLAAGKTYDVTITPPQAAGNYTPTTYAVFDRELSLSTGNQRDGGMQAYVAIAGGAASGAGTGSAAATLAGASDRTYYCSAGRTLSISDAGKGVLGGVTGANGAALSGTPAIPAGATLAFQSNGTFVYTPPPSGACGGSFSYLVNGIATTTYTATIAECDASSSVSGCPLGGPPVAQADSYSSNVASTVHIAAPGVLSNDTDPANLQLKVDTTSIIKTGANAGALTVAVLDDGSFTASATAPGTYTFTYADKNSQGTASATPAQVTVVFPTPSNLKVSLVDALDHSKAITDYRWIIEEDRTFWVDPACQVNSTDPAVRPASCPPLPVQSLGYNFHTANMPVIASGCTGATSCESGQTLLGQAAACDLGDGQCHTDASQKVPLDPGQVHLDPNKRYYLSVAPADGINPTLNGQGAPVSSGRTDSAGNPILRKFTTSGGANNMGDCTSFDVGTGNCGHSMGGEQIASDQKEANIVLQRTPLPTSQITVFVYSDDNPLNGENDAGGGVDVLAPNEAGLGSFNVILLDQAGGLGDNTGQITYDMFNMPITNAYASYIDPITKLKACPLTSRPDALVGVVVTCPTYESDGKTLSPLAGQALISNLYPGLYEVQAMPAADRIARGEEWLQTNTLDGGKPHEAFVKPDEPAYFQEFGPGGFHIQIGFANPKIINARLTNSAKTGICDPAGAAGGGGLACSASLYGQVQGTHMSRTPDERTYASGDYTFYGFTQCYIGIGPADGPDFAFAKCDQDGNFHFDKIPEGDFKLTVFDQWNDIMLDGLVTPVHVASGGSSPAKPIVFPVTQWRTNLYTRTFIDSNKDGVSNLDANGNPTENGLPLIATNIRYRDGSFGFFNSTDLNGYAGWNEVFPFMNWLVVEADATRYKQTGTHVVIDTGGPTDGHGGANSAIAAGLANTTETNSLPQALRVPGSVYCADADCTGASIANGPYGTGNAAADTGPLTGLSSGRIDPPQPFGTTEGWQGLLGQSTFMEFGMTPFVPGENGGIRGHVIYASTRPFDDPQLLLQLQWEPGVPHVKINLYQEGTAADGQTTLKLVDTTTTTSFDDWAQGFRRDVNGNPIPYTYTDSKGVSHTGYVPNMNCPGQDVGSPFYATLQGSTQWLDNDAAHPGVATRADGRLDVAANSQFKCYDGWSQLNQAQPAPYDGKYTFPSITATDPATGRPAGTNCSICVANPSGDGTKMLPAGKYVVEVIVPPGFELVKEEDKNILLGDIYVAPVTIQFPGGAGNIFIMPDQASVNSAYNKNNPLNSTTDLGSVTFARHEGDTGSIESYWPCVGALRVVPDYNSLFPGAQQAAPFAGATRPLCDRKEVTLEDQSSALAKFYVFTPTQIAGHFTGLMTNDFASEFDPFSPQFGEKFGPPNLPVGMRDFAGNEMGRVYADQWGVYNGLFYSSWEVNPPNPTGFAPQMAIACMNDPGPIVDRRPTCDGSNANYCTTTPGASITDPAYNPAYSNFCYETPFMPGFTAYMDTPVIPTQAFADSYNLPDAEYPNGTPAVKSVAGDLVDGVAGPWVSASGHTLTITAVGDKVVINPDFSGPGATVAPYNQKTIVRHYGFGDTPGTVTIAGVAATCSTWSDLSLTCTVPVINAALNAATGVGSTCASTSPPGAGQTPAQMGVVNTGYRCGELVISTADGKRSTDAITVTVAGKQPTVVNGENVAINAIQTAVDAATPGDLIIVGPGAYKEHILMWKPVRLQGVGAASTTINADAHPAGVLDPWRRQVNCLFGLTLDGVPNPDDAAFDPSGQYTCPTSQYFRVDRIPFEAIIGWDASGNGNLAQVLQEPTLMGAYEGAGITVLGRGVKAPATGPFANDFWGQNATGGAGAFTDGSVWLTRNDCTALPTTDTSSRDYGTSNFYCNPSRIDGLSVINSSQGGGAIFVHGWAHNLDIANTRIYANHGTLTGGINLGTGETPDAFLNDGVECGVNPVVMPCPPIPPGTAPNAAIPFAFNTKVHMHHNAIYNNASVGDALFSGTPSGAGAVTISAGSDSYELDHNWIAGNLSTGDGGGVVHLGLSFNGKIDHNAILFNQSTNPTLPTNGGGLAILGANQDQLVNGIECGSTTDNDCPPGVGEGTGPGLVIDSNLIMGNSAESGSGGGLRLQQVNGSEVGNFLLRPAQWYDVKVTNNVIANNVAGWDGAGVSLEDTLRATMVNNTIVSNDTTSSAGVLFKTLGSINASSPPPGCQTDPTLAQTAECLNRDAAHIPQPAGLVVLPNTPNLQAVMNSGLLGLVACPAGQGYTAMNCKQVSIPQLTNDLFWQNRAFHVEISGSGTGLQSQQNLIALVPQLNQASTGFCAASGLSADGASTVATNYWDIGVRGDHAPNDGLAPGAGGAKLTANYSILTPVGATYGGSNNLYPTTSPVNAMYCNGSRVPPENGGHGYQAPAGASETTGLITQFVFNNIAPAATVDEGTNWINLSYGPLTLFSDAGKAMLATGPNAATLGAYAIGGGSSAVNKGTSGAAPAVDFFGNPRIGTADIGAVEFMAPNVAVPVVSPSPFAFGAQIVGTSSTKDLTLVNNGGAVFTGIAIGLTGPDFARITSGSFPAGAPNCAGTLAVGASCTIRVRYAAPTMVNTASSGTVTIAGNVAVINAPVTLTGNAVAATHLASVSPSPLAFGTWTTGVTSAPLNLTVTNTGNSPLASLTYTFGGGAPGTFARVTSGPFPAGAPNCGATLAMGASCTYKVSFRPGTSASFGRILTVAGAGATVTPSTVSLTGTGVATRAPVTISPNPMTITLPTGAFTGTGSVTFTNNGAANDPTVPQVVVTKIATPGGSVFSYFFNVLPGSDTCTGVALAPQASCTVGVRFTNVLAPRGVNRTGTLRFTDTGAGSPQSAGLIGFATP